MPPRGASPLVAGRYWVRLRFTGNGESPNRTEVGLHLLQSQWINAADIYSFITAANKKEYEICFHYEQALQRFTQIFNNNSGGDFWRYWELTSSTPQDVRYIVVKFWTGRVVDEDIEHYLRRFCDILQPVQKPVDQFGIWYGVRRYKVKLKKDSCGELIQIPNTIAMGPYNGKISYQGQIQRCFICNSSDHQARDCKDSKCWKCGQLGHKGKTCSETEICSLCEKQGHSFFQCPSSYCNKVKGMKQHTVVPQLTSDKEVVHKEGVKSQEQGEADISSSSGSGSSSDSDESSNGSSTTSRSESSSSDSEAPRETAERATPTEALQNIDTEISSGKDTKDMDNVINSRQLQMDNADELIRMGQKAMDFKAVPDEPGLTDVDYLEKADERDRIDMGSGAEGIERQGDDIKTKKSDQGKGKRRKRTSPLMEDNSKKSK